MLRNILPTSKERELYEADHEYEPLEKYNQHNDYDNIQAPSDSSKCKIEPENLSLDGDYESIPCPAYISVVTTSIHANDQLEASSIGSQDDQKDNEV